MLHGLDTGSRKFHVVREDGHFCSHRVPARVATDVARIELAAAWADYVDSHVQDGDVIVCEEPLALQNGKTSRVLAMAASALYVVTFHPVQRRVTWRWADVAHWKAVIVGRGNADKDQIDTWVREHLGIQYPEQDYHDAACILEFGKLWEILGEKPPTKAPKQRKRKAEPTT